MELNEYLARAESAVKEKDWVRVYALISKILLFDLEDCEWLYFMAKSAKKIGKWSDAEKYSKAYIGAHDCTKARKLLVKVYIATNQLDLALDICPESMKPLIIRERELDDLGKLAPLIQNLKSWIENHGGFVNKIKIQNFPCKFLGVASCSYLEPGTTVLQIPKSLIITRKTVEGVLPADLVSKIKLNSSLFALFLALELRNANSPWKKYLTILPEDFSNFPLFFNEEEKALLKGSSYSKLLDREERRIKEDFMEIEHYGLVSIDEFFKGKMVVSSRTFSLQVEKDESALIPFADFFNHSCNSSVDWHFDFESQGFVVVLNEGVARGEEICIDYGKKSNAKLFIGYGFVLENNPYNECFIQIKLKKNDRLFYEKQKILGSREYFSLSVDASSASFTEILGCLRLRFLSDPDILLSNEEKCYNLKNITFISKENELNSLHHLEKICKKALSLLPPLPLPTVTSTHKAIYTLLSDEHEILSWAISFSSAFSQFLSSLSSLPSDPSYSHYITAVIYPNLC